MEHTYEAMLSPEHTPPTICIVEDDRATGEVIQLMIAEETLYHPLLFTCGTDALHALPNLNPQLFIFDYCLPDMTGVELFNYLRELPQFQHVPAILASASKQINEIEPCGMVMLNKPFDIDEFLVVIEQLIMSTIPSC